MRPTAESLSACSACGTGGPPVWSHITQRMLNEGTVPAATSLLKSCSPQIYANRSGMPRSNCGKFLMRWLYTAGIEDSAWTVF